MNFRQFFSLGIMLFCKAAIAQTNLQSQITLKNIIPPTANAAALGKFGDIPVGNYTGVPSVTIPLHKIKIKDFELPITLAYHGSGIKVEDISSDVGLGWALDAGGAISTTVNGLDDWGVNGFCRVKGDPYKTLPDQPMGAPSYDYFATDIPGGWAYNFANNIARGECDAEPDLYFYNFCGRTGKFFFDQSQQAHTIPLTNLSIKVPVGKFIIVDENGVKYTFQDQEGTIMANGCNPQEAGNSSSLLSRIDLPDKNYIQFNYTTVYYDYKINITQARNDIMPGNFGGAIIECSNTNKTVNCTSKRLISISSSLGDSVLFTYALADRADLPGSKSLSKIIIKHYSRIINQYTLGQGYFNGASIISESCRLKLEQVSDMSGAVHKFVYDTSIILPSRLSFAQDHWGFWNGKTNNTALFPVDIEHGFYTGNNRDIDTNYSKIGVLKRITYPTGGYTDLEFEPNDYFYSGNRDTYVFRDQQLYQSSSVGQTVTKTFVVPSSPITAMVFNSYYDAGPGSPTDQDPENPPLSVTLSGPNGYYKTFYHTTTANGIGLTNLAPGTYTMAITTNETYSGGYLRITYYEKTSATVNENTLVGGVRIKRTIDYPIAGSTPVIKRYKYRQFADTTKSSGRINYEPIYTAGYTHCYYNYQKGAQGDTVDITFSYANFWKQSASTVMPLGAINGGPVAYTNVAVLNGENGENGKTEFEYSFAQRSNINQWYPLVPSESRDWMNGLLQQQRDYRKNLTGSYTLLKEIKNYYSVRQDSEYWNYHFTPASYQSNEYVRGWGLRMIYKHPAFSFGLVFKPAEFTFNDFHHTSKWQRQDSSVTTLYADNGFAQTIKQLNYYDNPAHLYPNRLQTYNSKGDAVLTESHYPQDVISGLSTAAKLAKDSLVARHIINPVMENIITTKNIHTRSVRTDFKYWSNGQVLPEYLLDRNGGDAYTNRLQFLNYDGSGNLLQQAKLNDVPETYIWGYGNQLPVARIVGAVDYNAVIALVSQTIVQTPSSDALLRSELNKIRTGTSALVSTYTYLPGVGVTSETDPKGYTTYFEYDPVGRLKLVKDKDGKILKQYDYQYQQSITQ